MDSRRRRLSFLLLFFITAAILFPNLSSASSRESVKNSEKSKVTLAIYYESLCPYCSNFIVNDLVELFESGLISDVDLKLIPYGNARIGPNDTLTCQIFDTGLISILDLNLVPWGNARILANNTFDCQHGPLECLLNTVEACAISVWPDLNKHFPFIYCVETLVYEHQYTQWETCFEKLDLDPTLITECYSSGYGKELELQYAAETNTLQPPHEYVPWVVVDGVPLYEDYENFISYICKGYKGTALPQSCVDLALNTIPKDKASPRRSSLL
ncbi:hypothetical protein HYC85_031651 [Camellia sinensis]|uniref:Gamma-interferon-inducible lysosomal thiol reductase n=1 Tax=Camellia sinensis TaxID=4442 RepID=A0A7J7FSV2_CAMSI|nr:hypothetical protein HYC85_031651 [Camellia sinensis]